MELFIARILPAVLGIHGLLVAAGAFSGIRAPASAAALYTDQASRADPVFLIMMAPLQVVIALLMFVAAHALAARDVSARRHAALALLLFAVMEIGFVAARFRVQQLRSAPAWWRLPVQGPVVSLTACGISAFFAVIYVAGWLAIRSRR